MTLILAFDTSTTVATSALVRDGEVLGEAPSVARTLLVDVDRLLRETGLTPGDLEAIVAGIGPGSFTSTRMGVAAARALAFSLGIPVAGVGTLDALAAAAPGAHAIIDARRGEVFVEGPAVLRPENMVVEAGGTYVGDGAQRYRELLEGHGACVPADDSSLHLPSARHHARLARTFGPPEALEPIYVRKPDAERSLA
jgi:tRNA threonylcarbamoyl adenosine modification protein YeaZ